MIAAWLVLDGAPAGRVFLAFLVGVAAVLGTGVLGALIMSRLGKAGSNGCLIGMALAVIGIIAFFAIG